MNRLALWVLLAGALVFASTATAGVIFIPIGGFTSSDLGDTSADVLPSGEVRVSALGLEGTGTLDCEGNAGCIAAGLDGAAFAVAHDLQIVIDFTGAGVRGQSRGTVSISAPGLSPFDLRGRVRGRAVCNAGSCAVEMQLRANLADIDGMRAGRLELSLSGTLLHGPGPQASWSSLDGDGTLRLKTPRPSQD